MKDIRAKILSNDKIGNGYYKIGLEAPYIAKNAGPGQFVQVRCSDGADPLLRRPFSVHRVKGQKEIEVLYEVIGKGTEILAKKKRGVTLDVLGPLGNGFSLPQATSRQQAIAILIAGGIGVAPLVYLGDELAKKKIKTIILIGARTKKLILCEKDFKKLGGEVHIATDDGSHGCKGFVSQLLQNILGAKGKGREAKVYACGPNSMLGCIASICKEKKIDCEVSLEEVMACGIGACLGCAVKSKGGGYKLACKDGPVFNSKDLIWT